MVTRSLESQQDNCDCVGCRSDIQHELLHFAKSRETMSGLQLWRAKVITLDDFVPCIADPRDQPDGAARNADGMPKAGCEFPCPSTAIAAASLERSP